MKLEGNFVTNLLGGSPTKIKKLLVLMMLLFPASVFAGTTEDLLKAANMGDVKAIGDLLGKGADVNAKNEHGSTALSVAAANDRIEAMQLLLDKGADLNVKDKEGKPFCFLR